MGSHPGFGVIDDGLHKLIKGRLAVPANEIDTSRHAQNVGPYLRIQIPDPLAWVSGLSLKHRQNVFFNDSLVHEQSRGDDEAFFFQCTAVSGHGSWRVPAYICVMGTIHSVSLQPSLPEEGCDQGDVRKV